MYSEFPSVHFILSLRLMHNIPTDHAPPPSFQLLLPLTSYLLLNPVSKEGSEVLSLVNLHLCGIWQAYFVIITA